MNRNLSAVSMLLLLSGAFLLLVPYAHSSLIADVSVKPVKTTAGRLGKTFDVNVTISDVTNLYAYEFKLGYNTTLLDATRVRNGTFFPLPPKSWVAKMAVNDTAGVVWVAVTLLAPELPKSGSGVLARITFNVTYTTIWPETAGCPLHLYDVKLSDSGANTIVCNVLDGQYEFVPLHEDLNRDGKVDVFDLIIVGIAFGSTPADLNWDPRADLKPDNIIDIYDIVLVAANFGKVG